MVQLTATYVVTLRLEPAQYIKPIVGCSLAGFDSKQHLSTFFHQSSFIFFFFFFLFFSLFYSSRSKPPLRVSFQCSKVVFDWPFLFILGGMEMVHRCRALLADRDRNARMNGQINRWVPSRPDGGHLSKNVLRKGPICEKCADMNILPRITRKRAWLLFHDGELKENSWTSSLP